MPKTHSRRSRSLLSERLYCCMFWHQTAASTVNGVRRCFTQIMFTTILCPFIQHFSWANIGLPFCAHSQFLISADNCSDTQPLLGGLLNGRAGRDLRGAKPRWEETVCSSQMKIVTRAYPDQLPCLPLHQTWPLTSPFGLSESPALLSFSSRSALPRKMIQGADHRLSHIRGGDSQVPFEPFVAEVSSEAPLTLNYIS